MTHNNLALVVHLPTPVRRSQHLRRPHIVLAREQPFLREIANDCVLSPVERQFYAYGAQLVVHRVARCGLLATP